MLAIWLSKPENSSLLDKGNGSLAGQILHGMQTKGRITQSTEEWKQGEGAQKMHQGAAKGSALGVLTRATEEYQQREGRQRQRDAAAKRSDKAQG